MTGRHAEALVGLNGAIAPVRRTPVARFVAAMVVVGALAAWSAGCGGDDDASDTGTADSADETGEVTTADSGTAGTATDETATSETATSDGGEPRVDPSIEVPEWVEVVGVAETLNVRAGPGADFDRVGQAALGDTLRVLGGANAAGGAVWLQVEVDGSVTGWVSQQFTSGIARPTPTPLPTPTPVGTPTPLPVEGGGDGDGSALVVVAPDGLNLRAEPGLGTQVLLELDDGDEVQGTGATRRADGRRWTEVSIDGVTGWVASEFVAPA